MHDQSSRKYLTFLDWFFLAMNSLHSCPIIYRKTSSVFHFCLGLINLPNIYAQYCDYYYYCSCLYIADSSIRFIWLTFNASISTYRCFHWKTDTYNSRSLSIIHNYLYKFVTNHKFTYYPNISLTDTFHFNDCDWGLLVFADIEKKKRNEPLTIVWKTAVIHRYKC